MEIPKFAVQSWITFVTLFFCPRYIEYECHTTNAANDAEMLKGVRRID